MTCFASNTAVATHKLWVWAAGYGADMISPDELREAGLRPWVHWRHTAQPIEEKALQTIFAMDDAAAQRLHSRLKEFVDKKGALSSRTTMFLGARDDR